MNASFLRILDAHGINWKHNGEVLLVEDVSFSQVHGLRCEWIPCPATKPALMRWLGY